MFEPYYFIQKEYRYINKIDKWNYKIQISLAKKQLNSHLLIEEQEKKYKKYQNENKDRRIKRLRKYYNKEETDLLL